MAGVSSYGVTGTNEHIIIDFSEPFKKWKDTENESMKKIIPVRVGEVDLVWWLNVKNPIYQQIMEMFLEIIQHSYFHNFHKIYIE